MQQTVSAKNTGSELQDRLLWKRESSEGPVLVLFAGIHGNELAGIKACNRLIPELEELGTQEWGSIFMITGNRKALSAGVRFVDRDLNRIWNDVKNDDPDAKSSVEWKEATELLQVIEEIIQKHKESGRRILFADLHTTSAESCAFIPFNDTLENREIAHKFPVPQILGIEEFIQGTLLSYINDLGYACIGFEAGSHTDPHSVDRAESFLRLFLYELNMIDLSDAEYESHSQVLTPVPDIPETYYEIIYHHYVEDASDFHMKKGYINFDHIEEGELLAFHEGERVHAPQSGLIFMPLYQAKGNDGFFIIRDRSPVWLQLSAILRDTFLNDLLHYLPGVKEIEKGHFTVNLNIARFFSKELFHLLGYRVIQKEPGMLEAFKRVNQA